MDWERIFNTYGWPSAILLVVTVVFYKAVWPRITLYLDDQRRVAEEARITLVNRAQKLEEREDTLLEGFKRVLDSSTERNQRQLEVLDEIAALTRDTNMRVREGK